MEGKTDIKQRLPRRYAELFGRDDYAIDDELREADRPPPDRLRPGDPAGEDDPIPGTDPGGTAAA